jgi:hypothetical protein
MSSKNGKSQTSMTIDGIVIDLNRISKREYFGFISALTEATNGKEDGVGLDVEEMQASDEITGQLAERVVVSWPFVGAKISKDGYLDLGMLDSKRVSDALTAALQSIGEKKESEPPSSSRPEKAARLKMSEIAKPK